MLVSFLKAPFHSTLTKKVSLNILNSNYDEFLDLLKPIAVKRVSGTPENEAVRNVRYFFTK